MTLGCHKDTYKQQMSVDSIITYKFRTGLLRIHCHLGLSYVCGLVSELSVLFWSQCHLQSSIQQCALPYAPTATGSYHSDLVSLQTPCHLSTSSLDVTVLNIQGLWLILAVAFDQCGNVALFWNDFLAHIGLFFWFLLPTNPSPILWQCVEERQVVTSKWDHILGIQWLWHKRFKGRHGWNMCCMFLV